MTYVLETVSPASLTFDAEDRSILARSWYPVALAEEVEGAPLPARLLDEPLVVYRAGAEVVVANDICPHRGVPLSVGSSDERGITCAYHGLRFGAGGRCEHIPAHPDSKIPARLNLRSYPAVERYGLIWTCLQPEETDATMEIPTMPHWEEPGFQRINCPPFDIAAFAGRQVEGFLDVAHFGFVHLDTFGDPDDTTVPDYHPVEHERGFSVDYWSTVSNYPRGTKEPPPGFQWLRRFDVHLPFTATLVVHFPEEGRLAIMNVASPVSARQTRLFVPIARNFDTERPIEEVHTFNLRVFQEDAEIVEIQKPENLPLDPKLEVHISADRSSIAYRRGLRRLGLSQFFTA